MPKEIGKESQKLMQRMLHTDPNLRAKACDINCEASILEALPS